MSSYLLPVFKSIFYVIFIYTAFMLYLILVMLSVTYFSNSSYFVRIDFFCSFIFYFIYFPSMFMGVNCSRYFLELLIIILSGFIL